MPKPGPLLSNDYALPFLGPSSDPYNFLPRLMTLPPYALTCFVLQLHLPRRNNLQRDLRKIAMSIYDQTRIYHLFRLSLRNINYNINEMNTTEEKTRVWFLCANLNLKTRHTGLLQKQLRSRNKHREDD